MCVWAFKACNCFCTMFSMRLINKLAVLFSTERFYSSVYVYSVTSKCLFLSDRSHHAGRSLLNLAVVRALVLHVSSQWEEVIICNLRFLKRFPVISLDEVEARSLCMISCTSLCQTVLQGPSLSSLSCHTASARWTPVPLYADLKQHIHTLLLWSALNWHHSFKFSTARTLHIILLDFRNCSELHSNGSADDM